MLKRIAITGPESTGKTWLSKRLAEHYSALYVHEYAVEYLNLHGEKYMLEDVLNIAKGQLELEEKISEKAKNLLFCDTDMIVTKIWCKEVFGQVPSWIEDNIIKYQYDLFLLCAPDIKWEAAPFRENQNNRDVLYRLYEKELQQQNFNFRVIKGVGDERLKNAVNFVDELINE